MTISVNHLTKVISIPKSDTTFLSTNALTGYEVRSYDEYQLMRELASYLDSEDGVALPSAFTHATQVTISGVVYARSLSFLAPYTVTFENGSYQVKLVGGTNNNMLDVLNPNNVSVIPANSAGLQAVATGGSVAPTAVENAAAVRVNLSAELLRILELAAINGLVLGSPLVVGPTTRTSGALTQTISEVGDTTTVTRAP